ncbi:hypothetical protein N0B16_13805 [Chryseobacterium sp. GMJ5]|uniref:Uncharacterized protein n=1 Tax=Chryseobacterium gilvum TaxID=2976534 RepID=A0ABT2VZT4_9FLAO|nr:hypothetical protein [Chryseobacterium gilvum]MCU7615507.1 hypothetical protein [Chryseobacterium gilvum]
MKAKFFSLLSFLMIFLSFQSCITDQENTLKDKTQNSSDKNHTISAKDAQIFEDEYLAHNYRILSDSRSARGLSSQESRQVIYPIEVLEDYVHFIKQRAGENAMIEINLGQYPEGHLIDDRQNEEYEGYQTVFLNAHKGTEEGDSTAVEMIPALNHGSLIPPSIIISDDPGDAGESFEGYLITSPAAKMLYDTYTNTNEKILNENGVEVQRTYLYSIQALESYFAYVRSEARRTGNENVNVIINIGQDPVSTATAGKNVQHGNQRIYFTAAPKNFDVTSKKVNPLKNLDVLVSH